MKSADDPYRPPTPWTMRAFIGLGLTALALMVIWLTVTIGRTFSNTDHPQIANTSTGQSDVSGGVNDADSTSLDASGTISNSPKPSSSEVTRSTVKLFEGEPFNAGCSLPNGDLVVPQSISRADSWDRVGEKILLPRKKDIGPEKVTGSVRHCFAKSGEGLVYAAVTYMTQSPSIEEYSSQSAQKLFIHPEYANDGKTQVLVGPLNDAMPNVSELKPVGWEITDLNELDGSAEVNVAYLSRGINGAQVLASSRARLKWANGDWRLVSQSEPQQIAGLTPMMQPLE